MDINNTNNSNFGASKSDGIPDIRKIFQLLISNWYLFLISFPLCFGGVFLYHRYTPVVYKGSATVMLKSDEPKTISRAELIEGFGLSPELKSLENQTIILRSKKVVKRAIDRLDFGIDIYSNGVFKDFDLYKKAPFNIEMDSLSPQVLNVPIYVQPTSNNKVIIKIEANNGLLHTFNNEKTQGGSGLISFEKEINWGDEIHTPFCKFKISRNVDHINSDIEYYFYFRSHDWLANTYRGRIGVQQYKEGSSIIYISSTGTNTYKILNFLNKLTEVYLEQSLERKNDIASRTINFIDSQLKLIEDSLTKAQERLMNFKRSNAFSAPTEISERLANQYFEYEKEFSLINLRNEYFKSLKNHLINDPLSEDYLLPAFSQDANNFISSLVTELLALHNEHNMLKEQTTVSNPYLDDLERKIDVCKSNLLLSMDKLLKNTEIEKNRIQSEMVKLSGKLHKLPEAEREFLNIERDYKLNDAIYTFLLQKQSETQITKASNIPDNEIIDEASITSIVSPNKSKDNKQMMLLAFVLPIAIIVLKEYFNNKVRSKDDITSIVPQIPIIGYVSQYKGTNYNIITDEPLSSISESFRALRTKLKFMCQSGIANVITISSTNTGEGKTFCALNLASAFAISGKKTVLVGFDLRKPRLTEIFKHQNHNGLSNYLIGQANLDQIIYGGNTENLSIIPSGAIPPNPSELISNSYAEQLFEELKQRFDVVIVDSPPIGIVADSRVLMEYSNCQLFVVRANKTIKDHFKHTIQNLVNDNIQNIGFILNDISSNLGGYNYYADRYYSDIKK